MLRTSFKIGLTFIDGQTRRQIRRRLPTGKIQLEADNGCQSASNSFQVSASKSFQLLRLI